MIFLRMLTWYFSPSRFFLAFHLSGFEVPDSFVSWYRKKSCHIYALSVKDWSMVIVMICEFAQFDDFFGLQVFTWILASSSSGLSDSWSDDEAFYDSEDL